MKLYDDPVYNCLNTSMVEQWHSSVNKVAGALTAMSGSQWLLTVLEFVRRYNAAAIGNRLEGQFRRRGRLLAASETLQRWPAYIFSAIDTWEAANDAEDDQDIAVVRPAADTSPSNNGIEGRQMPITLVGSGESGNGAADAPAEAAAVASSTASLPTTSVDPAPSRPPTGVQRPGTRGRKTGLSTRRRTVTTGADGESGGSSDSEGRGRGKRVRSESDSGDHASGATETDSPDRRRSKRRGGVTRR